MSGTPNITTDQPLQGVMVCICLDIRCKTTVRLLRGCLCKQPSCHIQQYRYSYRIDGRPGSKKSARKKTTPIARWNVMASLDRIAKDRLERRTPLVAMELAKYNIDITVLSEHIYMRLVVWTICSILSIGVAVKRWEKII